MPSQATRSDRLLLVAFALSGCAALGYELLWTRLLSLGLGSETLGVLAVLAGFFGGMALGSAALHDRVRRSPDPIALFVRLELLAAGYALISPWLLHALAEALPAMLGSAADGPGIVQALLVAGLALLPGSFCLGATLACLVEGRRRVMTRESEARGMGRLYAANTIGATVGVLITVHVLLPALGIAGGAAVLAAIGATAAMTARRYRSGIEYAAPEQFAHAPIHSSHDPDPDVASEPWLVYVLLLCTGLVGVGLEVVGIRVLGQILENTIYTFADTLAVYLLGTAIGAAIYGRYAARAMDGRPATVAAGLLLAAAAAVVVSAIAMGNALAIVDAVAGDGATYGAHLAAEAVVAAAAFGIPTLVMGALFSHLTGLVSAHGVGRAYAINTLGAALAPLVFGVFVIENYGYGDAMYVLVYAYLGLFGLFTWFRRFKPAWQIGAILGVVALTAAAPKSLVLVEPDEGWATIEQRETPLGLVVVSELQGSDPPLRRLQVGHHFRMGGALAFGERRMGYIPLLLAPQAQRVLFLGVGTGATAGAVQAFRDLKEIDAVELMPAVLDQLHHFESINGHLEKDPRVRLHAADARRFVAAADEHWDVVIADLFHPAIDGAGNLYAREHFEHVRSRLTDGGLFAQWLPLYQLDGDSLRTVMRTFVDVFPEVHSFLAIYNVDTPALVLVGSNAALSQDAVALRTRLAEPGIAMVVADARDFLGSYMLDRDALVAFAGEGPMSTDLRPRIALTAPRGAYLDDSSRAPTNLRALLDARTAVPRSLVSGSAADEILAAAAPFADAVGHYLTAELTRQAQGPQAPPSHAVIDEYLASHRAAPDFGPTRGALYRAAKLGPALADVIYPALIEITPNDIRPYRAYVEYLREIGDTERINALREVAEQHFDLTPPGGAADEPPEMLRP